MRILAIIILIIGFTTLLNTIDSKSNKIFNLKTENKKLYYQRDSIIFYYEDISNCIKKDFDIKHNCKIKYKKK